ncbi:hypothetical protein DSO57_1020766 [Entomophthora muscae]|uniref:Uncharacterized protein n=1 Tax=Entomophthora muscae TaxID=34485 RepID=A0ACC2RUM5_9FUNG|nr:hypothetical protein DSO57_1020766 [Entomophthora muscae]
MAAFQLKPSDILLGHLIATNCGVVYIEVIVASQSPSSQSLCVEIVWSMPEPVVGLAFHEYTLAVISQSGISVLLQPTVTQNTTHGWMPVSRTALPLKQKLQDWAAFQTGTSRLIALADVVGNFHLIRIHAKAMAYLGSVENLEIKAILPNGQCLPLLWPNGFPTLNESSLLCITLAGRMVSIQLKEATDADKVQHPSGGLTHPSASSCLSQLDGFAKQAALLKEVGSEFDGQLEILRTSLEFAYLLRSRPDLLHIELMPYMDESIPQVATKVVLKSTLGRPIEIPEGWAASPSEQSSHWLPSFEATFTLPPKLNEACTWQYKLPNSQLLPATIECGLKFILPPASKAEGAHLVQDAFPNPNGYYMGSYIILCTHTLDLLHFATEDANTVQHKDRIPHSLENIMHAKLDVPFLPTHPFHADNLNAALLNQPRETGTNTHKSLAYKEVNPCLDGMV